MYDFEGAQNGTEGTDLKILQKHCAKNALIRNFDVIWYEKILSLDVRKGKFPPERSTLSFWHPKASFKSKKVLTYIMYG